MYQENCIGANKKDIQSIFPKYCTTEISPSSSIAMTLVLLSELLFFYLDIHFNQLTDHTAEITII